LTNEVFVIVGQYIQLLVIPIAITLASFVGIAVTSAGVSLYGQFLWDPLKLIDQWDNRACAFFTSLVFGLSTLCTNISANSLDAGNELAAMYPRYINIRRGQVICALLGGWALFPWKILARWSHHQNDIRFLTILDRQQQRASSAKHFQRYRMYPRRRGLLFHRRTYTCHEADTSKEHRPGYGVQASTEVSQDQAVLMISR
jgi:hypothetical protein